MQHWPQVELAGKEFMIPRVCPNCLAPADVPIRTDYTKQQVGSRARYSMTFYYCGACDEMLKQGAEIRRQQESVGPHLGFAILMFLVFLVVLAIGLNTGQDWIAFVALAGAGGLVWQQSRKWKAKRQAMWDEGKPPLPPNAVGYTLAAYLIDTKGGIIQQKTATFAAARADWLDLLVRANQDAV